MKGRIVKRKYAMPKIPPIITKTMATLSSSRRRYTMTPAKNKRTEEWRSAGRNATRV